MDKPGLAILLGMAKRKKDEEGEETSLPDLAQEILDAIKDEDSEALSSALEAFILECK